MSKLWVTAAAVMVAIALLSGASQTPAEGARLDSLIDRFMKLRRDSSPGIVAGAARQAATFHALRDELQAIPPGETRSYGEMARRMGRPGAARAVGRACATNPVAVVVPCHRAIGASGNLTGYRWGVDRKRALLDAESSRDAEAPASRPQRTR